MGEAMGLGITHFPRLMGPDADFTSALHRMLADPDLPEALRDPSGWPESMRAEYGDDRGLAAAAAHRERVVAGLRRTREALDAFAPDLVVIFTDDQYENFREQGMPAFCVQAYEDITVHPWREGFGARYAGTNVWGEGEDVTLRVRGARPAGKALVEGLLARGFDVAYAYEPSYGPQLSHAVLNSVLYLDYDRTGFPYPVLPVALNCYGRMVISFQGMYASLAAVDDPAVLDPPSPHPWRVFDFGAACAEVLAPGAERVAFIGSASWSHGFLARKNSLLYPDGDADRALYAALVASRFEAFRDLELDQVEASGQQEILNWVALAGVARALGLEVAWADLVETEVCNSNKCFAVLR